MGRGFVGLSEFRNGRWHPIASESGLPKEASVVGFYEDHQRTFWIRTSLGVFWRKMGDSIFRPLESQLQIRGLSEDATGDLWVLAKRSIHMLTDPSTNIRLADGLDGPMLRDSKGNLWIGTLGSGVICVSNLPKKVDPQPAQIERFTPADGLTSGVILSLLEDREGNIWLGTQSGLIRLSETSVVTTKVNGAFREAIRLVTAANDGSMWVGTSNGLFRFSNDNLQRYDERDGLPGVGVSAVHSDSQGGLWVAPDGGGVFRFKNGRFFSLFSPAQSQLKLIESLTTDHDGGIWFTENGHGVFRWKDGFLQSFNDVPQIRDKLGTFALTDPSGRVWIGFGDGDLGVFQDGKFIVYSKSDGLPGGSIGSIAADGAGAIWVGTTNGVSHFLNGRFTSLTTKNGLDVNNVTAIVTDLQGNIWIGATAGIFRLKPNEFEKAVANQGYQAQYTLYDIWDGLPGVPMSKKGFPSATRGPNGTLWFVTSNGLAVIDPLQPKKSRLPPPIRIERALVDDQALSPIAGISLAPLTSRVQIEYTALSFTVPSKVRFRYKLEGYDDGWVNAGTRRQAFYTNLPPREYRFHVIAENDGAWNETGAVWNFAIKPAFYQASWFRATCVAFAGLVSFAAWRLKVRQV